MQFKANLKAPRQGVPVKCHWIWQAVEPVLIILPDWAANQCCPSKKRTAAVDAS